VAARRPNLLLIVTDQQRAPQHWPDSPGWVRSLMPADAELARTGLTFRRAFCATAMCTPSRATLLTGVYPAQHGLPLTLTRGDLRPDRRRNSRATMTTLAGMLARGEVDRRRALAAFARGALQAGPQGGDEPVLRPGATTLATLLRGAGYEVAYKGKWHLTKPADGVEWAPADGARVGRDHGFADWEPPDAGEDARAEHFGGGNAGRSGEGFDEDFTGQAERWLGRDRLPEPFCLVVSLVNPHDVLGYPNSYLAGGYTRDEFADLDVDLPPTVDEHLGGKPSVHALMRLGQAAYLGGVGGMQRRRDYVRFYAHLHRIVDAKIGRLLRALGDAEDPASLRARTLVVRLSDHGEMGLSHGGLRQKMFNAYEETIRVPLVVSHPGLFRRPAETPSLASLVDVLPTVLTALGVPHPGGLRGEDLSGVLAANLDPDRELLDRAGIDVRALLDHPGSTTSVREHVHFTYDDHQAGTALQDVPGQPNRIRCVRDEAAKYAVYLDPRGRAAPEYELYDLARDPHEAANLVDHRTGEPRSPADAGLRDRMADCLEDALDRAGTALA
jgi:choline-sulfatase